MANKTIEQRRLEQLNGAEIILPDMTTDQNLEAVVTKEFDKTIAEEAFMNEIVEVMIAETTDENMPTHIILDVNNLKQPVFRGVLTPMRRMFVEVLARCKETKYKQISNAYEIDRPRMEPRTAQVYPFQMFDKNQRGQAWLKAVMAEAN